MGNKERAAKMTQDEIASLLADYQDITQRNEELQQQLDWLKRQLFGSKSERHIPLNDSRQLTLGEMGSLATAPSPEIEVPAHKRTKAHANADDEGSLKFDDSVPVEKTELPPDIPADQLDDYERIGEKTNRLLAQRPGLYFIREVVRPVYKKKAPVDAIEDGIVTADPPSTVLHRSFADVSLLACILVDKFRYHLPLYRQHQRMAACGVHISRGSLTNWVHRTCDLLLPIYEAQLQSILASEVLAMDETPIKAGRKKGSPGMIVGHGRAGSSLIPPLQSMIMAMSA